MCTSPLKVYCKNSKFYRGAYIAAYEMTKILTFFFKFSLRFTDLGKYLFREVFGALLKCMGIFLNREFNLN